MKGSNKKSDTEEFKVKLNWYTAALVLIFVVQMILCCAMIYWTKGKLNGMKKEQVKQQKEF